MKISHFTPWVKRPIFEYQVQLWSDPNPRFYLTDSGFNRWRTQYILMEKTMKNYRHTYEDVYYSDLDMPDNELKKLESFLKSHVAIGNIILVSIDEKTGAIDLKEYNGNYNSLIKYAFIRSDLAGVGNYNFIVERKASFEKEAFLDKIKQISLKDFFENQWIQCLFDEDIIESVLIVYCDGVWVDLYKK